jgi:predicted Zn finger-like uncharacterized protein
MIIPCESCQSTFELDSALMKASGLLVRCSKCRSVFRVYPPDAADRRIYPRTKTRNLISHISIDQTGKLVSRGLSKTLDISRGGMLLETPHPVEPGLLSLMAVDAENNLIEIKGELIYCKRSAAGMYHSGVKFIGSEMEVANFVIRLIKEYNHRKNSLYFDQAE